jgi:hypothetical protein
MRKLLPAVAAGLFCAAVILRANSARPRPVRRKSRGSTPNSPPVRTPTNATITKYCRDCHNDSDSPAKLSLDKFDVAHRVGSRGARREDGAQAARRDDAAERRVQPDAATRAALVTALETSLDKAAAAPNPGYRSFQRLNRAEYAAAIRAMLGIDDRRRGVPAGRHDQRRLRQHRGRADAVGHGHAGLPARRGVREPRRDRRSRRGSELDHLRSAAHEVAEGPRRGAPFGTRGGTVVTHNFLADGQYKFQMLLHGEPTGLDVRPDGAKAFRWKCRSTATRSR